MAFSIQNILDGGLAGYTGSAGTPGGPQGPQGYAGSLGPIGYTGSSGSQSGDQLVSDENNNTFSINNSGDVVLSGELGGVNRGLVWDYGAETGGVNSMVRQDGNGLTVRAWTEPGPEPFNAPVNIVTNQGADQNTWVFDGDGILTLPTGGDILDSNGDSVLGGGSTIPDTKRGFINLVGDRPNNDDDAWFESVVVRGNYAYVLGSDYYINNSNDRAKIYKFDVRTGEQIWVKQITAGRGSLFNLTIESGVITINSIVASGTDYKAGEEIPFEGNQIGGNWENNFIIIVDTIDGSGGIVTASVKPGYNVGVLSYNSNISSNYDDIRGDVCAIAYDDFNDKLIVVAEYQSGRGDSADTFWTWANAYVIDPETGVVNQTATLSDEGDIYPNSIATYDAAGGVAIVGEKYNEYREFGTLTMLATANGYFDILKSNIDPEHYPDSPYDSYWDFWVTGTGITGQNNVDGVNQYTNLATTVRQGSGAEFSIAIGGSGPYIYDSVTATTIGTNYRVGHKILVLGTALEGLTPTNDAIITVTAVDGNGGITGASISGTYGNAQAAPFTYSEVTGTNYQTGSGATFSITINPATGSFIYVGYNTAGSNYVVGDVITIAGTEFAGGASPANNAALVINSVDGSGGVEAITGGIVSGTGPTDVLRIRVDGVDFTAVGGEWSMRQNLGGEAFVWTPSWTNAIGGPTGDRFYDVTWSADGTALYAVGRGRYEVNYDQALVVKFDSTDGSIVWSKDIKFTEATTVSRQARAVCLVPNSTDIMVGGEWYNNSSEIILTRITAAGVAVWQKTYAMQAQGGEEWVDPEISLKAAGDNIIVSFEQGTNGDGSGLAFMLIDPDDGSVIRHRVFSSDSNANRVYYNTPTSNFTDTYSDATGNYVVMAGYTYVPTDNYYNSLLMKLPLDGLVSIDIDERWSIGEHIMNRHTVNVTTVTPAFDSFTADQHIDTITNDIDARNFVTRAPDAELKVWTHTITSDAAGYLEFGDGTKQSFATDKIPQIPAANDYWLTEQDSGKHIFFEHETGTVYIPHSSVRYFPVGFTFSIVNTTGSNCFLQSQSGAWERAIFKLAGRNITTPIVGIPDSGSGSMVTVMKIKDGYEMVNSDNDADYPDIWIVSGPADLFDDN